MAKPDHRRASSGEFPPVPAAPAAAELEVGIPPALTRTARPRRYSSDPSWHVVTRQLAGRVRQLRALLGVTQEELARGAGVSQGAISRMEKGRGHSISLMTYAKVFATLMRELEGLALELPAETRAFAAAVRALIPDVLVTTEAIANRPLARLIACFAALTPERQAAFLAVVEPLITYLRQEALREFPAVPVHPGSASE